MRPQTVNTIGFRLALCALSVFSTAGCDDDATTSPQEEAVSPPAAISGPPGPDVQQVGLYCCSGARSSEGHELEYRYDWGDGSTSGWEIFTCASHAWSSAGSYAVKVRARCKRHTDKVSRWSDPYAVEVTDPVEAVTVPEPPSGPLSCVVGQPEFFYTGGAASSMGHDLQYRFDWGDGRSSPWSYSDSAYNGWPVGGAYTIKAQARCAVHTHVLSPWSAGTDVDVVPEAVSPPDPPSGRGWVCPDQSSRYTAGGAASSIGDSLEYRFDWGDGGFSGWSPSTSEMHSWFVRDDYVVRAQARCAVHTSVVSDWSDGMAVKVNETLTEPPIPNGPTSSRAGATDNYCRGTSRSDCNHPVEYQWSINQELTEWGTASCRMITWPVAGTYDVKVRGRCSIHTDVRSPWSRVLRVTVSD